MVLEISSYQDFINSETNMIYQKLKKDNFYPTNPYIDFLGLSDDKGKCLIKNMIKYANDNQSNFRIETTENTSLQFLLFKNYKYENFRKRYIRGVEKLNAEKVLTDEQTDRIINLFDSVPILLEQTFEGFSFDHFRKYDGSTLTAYAFSPYCINDVDKSKVSTIMDKVNELLELSGKLWKNNKPYKFRILSKQDALYNPGETYTFVFENNKLANLDNYKEEVCEV